MASLGGRGPAGDAAGSIIGRTLLMKAHMHVARDGQTQTSSELWVHIPAVFLKNGFSPGEAKESLSESRSLGASAQASTAAYSGSPDLAVPHEPVSDVHFSPTLQTCAPTAGTWSIALTRNPPVLGDLPGRESAFPRAQKRL